jgi:hypothetical protein
MSKRERLSTVIFTDHEGVLMTIGAVAFPASQAVYCFPVLGLQLVRYVACLPSSRHQLLALHVLVEGVSLRTLEGILRTRVIYRASFGA